MSRWTRSIDPFEGAPLLAEPVRFTASGTSSGVDGPSREAEVAQRGREKRSRRNRHVLTVAVEDYFHVTAFHRAVRPKHWDRFESRLESNIEDLLDLLAERDARATFFVLGWTAERQPELVRSIVDAGHEVASRGYWPRGVHGMVKEEFLEDLQRTKEALESAGSNPIVGYRAGAWVGPADLWILDALAEQGYIYDSSINPVMRKFRSDPRRYEVHRHRHGKGDATIWEYPISTIGLLGWRIAISGGNWIRQLPHSLLRHATEHWDRSKDTPLVFYLMPWELDRDQPHVRAISRLNRLRHYRNLEKTRWVLRYYFEKFRFVTISSHLGLSCRAVAPEDRTRPLELSASPAPAVPAVPAGEPVTIVVPLYEESENIAYLKRTLLNLRTSLHGRYDLRFVLVDDGSSDDTWDRMQEAFSDVERCRLVTLGSNHGVSAAILRGLREADTEIVCSMDCDCSYDPAGIGEMIPLLDAADLVTASPYHPDGEVYNVPSWRLFLSRNLSRLYNSLLGQGLHTYTSCFRAYRRSAIVDLPVRNDDFLGIAEVVVQLTSRGGRVVEHPAMLESRIFGVSKMKTAATIRRHLGLLREIAFDRERFRGPPAGAGTPTPGRDHDDERAS